MVRCPTKLKRRLCTCSYDASLFSRRTAVPNDGGSKRRFKENSIIRRCRERLGKPPYPIILRNPQLEGLNTEQRNYDAKRRSLGLRRKLLVAELLFHPKRAPLFSKIGSKGSWSTQDPAWFALYPLFI